MTTPRPGQAEGALDPRMRRSIVAVAITGAALAASSLVVAGVSPAFSVAAGAAIATLNLWALARIIWAILPADRAGVEAQSKGAWGVVAALKIVGLLGVVWLLMRHGVVSPLPMLVGFGALPIGIAIGSLVSDRSALDPDDRP